ncbi:hypothetical protein ANPL_01925 [Anaplasma platys]|uniref:Outer membrane protein beta-barrel domain-containing protein n=1 Tax=Anaplasma platys TaxID=949 RepID=A0A858PY23_9RICK|nr:hypothetical protein [Anaplasma platys]QJC27485.1 hypothetical protein ANPL_01925 [Anaplasma platys]
MIDILSDLSALISNAKGLLPNDYKLGYTKNFSYSDPFDVPYEGGERNWDVSATLLWLVLNGKYYHELEFASLKASPKLFIGTERGRKIIDAVRLIWGIDTLSTEKIDEILTIQGRVISYTFHRSYPLSENTHLYFGAGMGLYKVINFQGFRRQAEDILGIMKNVKIGIMHRFSSKIGIYAGYNHRQSSWKFKSDEIYDEDGNSVVYDLEDFDFLTNGLEIGVRFSL